MPLQFGVTPSESMPIYSHIGRRWCAWRTSSPQQSRRQNAFQWLSAFGPGGLRRMTRDKPRVIVNLSIRGLQLDDPKKCLLWGCAAKGGAFQSVQALPDARSVRKPSSSYGGDEIAKAFGMRVTNW